MIKNLMLSFFICNLASVAFAGVQVGNGGGLAEKYVVLAYQNLGEYIERFIINKNPIDLAENSLLNAIASSLQSEYQNANQIQFLSGAEHPGFFDTAEPSRVAKTGNKIGDPIYINRDQIYNGGIPINLAVTIQILIHELGHHQDIVDHAFLDKVGADVGQSILNESFEAKFNTSKYNYKAQYFNLQTTSQLLVTNGNSLANFSKSLVSDLKWCRENEKLVRYTVTNLFWSGQSSGTDAVLRLQVKALCRGELAVENRLDSKREIALHFNDDINLKGRFESLDCAKSPQTCW